MYTVQYSSKDTAERILFWFWELCLNMNLLQTVTRMLHYFNSILCNCYKIIKSHQENVTLMLHNGDVFVT